MNKINHLFLVLFFSLWSVMTAFTQNLLEVKYEQTIKQFTAVTQSATLYYKDGKSMYIHSKGKKGNVMKNLDGSDWNEDLNTPFMTWYQDSIGAIVFKDYTNKVLKFRDFYEAKAYISQEDFPTFKWTVTREQKIVLGYTCYKAATQFRGRDYIAWFTMDIPVQAGPWKFWGLPGLILEATDNTNQIKFIAQSISYVSDKTIDLAFPENGTKVDIATFRKLDDIVFEKMKRSYESKDYGRDVQISITKKKYDKIEKNYD